MEDNTVKKRVCDDPFTLRYSPSEAKQLRDEFAVYFYDDIDTGSCIDFLSNPPGDRHRAYRGSYLTLYAKYLMSPLNFEILMRVTYDEDIQSPLFKNYEIIVHMLEIPFKDLPLYLNSKDEWVVFLAKWRLKHGK